MKTIFQGEKKKEREGGREKRERGTREGGREREAA
jgi:hypothetical protein